MEEKKELLDQDERVVEIELERLRGFVNHPFKVQADSQMIELHESIKKYDMDIEKYDIDFTDTVKSSVVVGIKNII